MTTVYIVYKCIPKNGRAVLHIFDQEELAKAAVHHYRMDETLSYYHFEAVEREVETSFIPLESP